MNFHYSRTGQDLMEEIKDNALSCADVTFCWWQSESGNEWQRGTSHPEDGSDWILDSIPMTASEFIERAEIDLERDLDETEKQKVRSSYRGSAQQGSAPDAETGAGDP